MPCSNARCCATRARQQRTAHARRTRRVRGAPRFALPRARVAPQRATEHMGACRKFVATPPAAADNSR
eukprot:7183063-Lingulodinium_polyedra.AAC.1